MIKPLIQMDIEKAKGGGGNRKKITSTEREVLV